MLQIRPIREPDDFARMAELLTPLSGDPTTAASLAEEAAGWPEPMQVYRIAAVDAADRLIAYGEALRFPWDKQGKFMIWVLTDPAFRHRGMGSALADEVERWARQQGATEFSARCRDNDEAARAFAEHRGYRVVGQIFESTLDLATFDQQRFAGVVDTAIRSGIRFFTMADAPGEESERKLYELMTVGQRDLPDWDGAAAPSFASWRRRFIEGAQARMDLIIIAADGDRFVGATVMRLLPETGAVHTSFTAVDREYRGRGLALALKLLAVEAARRYGAPYMRTRNHSKNEPMLAVNWKMGYVKAPGLYELAKN